LADNSLGCFVRTSEPGTITIQLIGTDGNYALAMHIAEAARLNEELAEQIVSGNPSAAATTL
jgi:hypothetical protein